MLRNVQEAKFRQIMLLIAARTLDRQRHGDLAFEPFFLLVLAHELMHGLGPHDLMVAGQPTTVRQALGGQYAALEEAKADMAGMFALHYLMTRGVVPAAMEQPLATAYLANCLRTLRFGLHEAHGRAVAMQLNYLLDTGAIAADPLSGDLALVPERFWPAVTSLTGEIMTIQAEGDSGAARVMSERLAVIRPALQQLTDRIADVPVDIAVAYAPAE